jgi:hypothetical protein
MLPSQPVKIIEYRQQTNKQTWKHGQVPKWRKYSKFAIPLNFTGMVALAEPKLLPIGD